MSPSITLFVETGHRSVVPSFHLFIGFEIELQIRVTGWTLYIFLLQYDRNLRRALLRMNLAMKHTR